MWPGDANYDGVANNIDLLQVAAAYGETGMQREAIGIKWNAIAAFDYDNSIGPNAINAKHADCDGNGEVNSDDLDAIIANYGELHARGTSSADGPAITLEWSSASDSQVCYSIVVGDGEASDLLGIALSLDYSQSNLPSDFNPQTQTQVNWDEQSWLFAGNESIELQVPLADQLRSSC